MCSHGWPSVALHLSRFPLPHALPLPPHCLPSLSTPHPHSREQSALLRAPRIPPDRPAFLHAPTAPKFPHRMHLLLPITQHRMHPSTPPSHSPASHDPRVFVRSRREPQSNPEPLPPRNLTFCTEKWKLHLRVPGASLDRWQLACASPQLARPSAHLCDPLSDSRNPPRSSARLSLPCK